MRQVNTVNEVMETIETTKDKFMRGAFFAIQPVGCGHRSGSDALLIAAGLPLDAVGIVADLGSGSGVAGLAAIAANPQLSVILVEKNKTMADLARKTLLLPENYHLSRRAKIVEADVTLTGSARNNHGLKEDMADYVIMNPPYNHPAQRVSPDGLKAQAHAMGTAGLDPWMRTAAAILKPGGSLILVYRTEKFGEVIACSQGRFGAISIVPVHSRRGESAKRLLFKMVMGSRAPLSVMPGIIMHDEQGGPTPQAVAIMNGQARIPFSHDPLTL